jgi:hypothetical protein
VVFDYYALTLFCIRPSAGRINASAGEIPVLPLDKLARRAIMGRQARKWDEKKKTRKWGLTGRKSGV